MRNSLIDFLFPKYCASCNYQLLEVEDTLCTFCLHDLAVYPDELQESAFQSTFYGRVNYEFAKTLFYFQKGTTAQRLIHQLKYKGQKNIGNFAAERMAYLLKRKEKSFNFDCVVPVPLHPHRLRTRGYNQIAGFGKVISKRLNLTYVDNVLYRQSSSASQVFKNRLARTEMIEGGFYLKNKRLLKNKHVILVDDLITTGSTIESCYLALRKAQNIKLSILSICLAR